MAMPVAQALTMELNRYTPCEVNINPKEEQENLSRMHYLVRQLLGYVNLYFNKVQVEKFVFGLRFVAERHAAHYRKDNFTPYLIHLLEVTLIIFEMDVYDFKTAVGALLHDTVEDGKALLAEVRKLFGAAIGNIVKLMSKSKKAEEKALYFSFMKNEVDLNCRWRVILIKLADRIHNIRTLYKLPREKQLQVIEETKREFPQLHLVLISTIRKLVRRGTIKNLKYLHLPFRLMSVLHFEMSRYT